MAVKKSWKVFSTWVPIIVLLLSGIGYMINSYFNRQGPEKKEIKAHNSAINSGLGTQNNNFGNIIYYPKEGANDESKHEENKSQYEKDESQNEHHSNNEQPKIVTAGEFGDPILGSVGPYNHGKDTISLWISYSNIGKGEAIGLVTTVAHLTCRNGSLSIGSKGVFKDPQSFLIFNSPQTSQLFLGGTMPEDSLFIYFKLDYKNIKGVKMDPLRRVFSYQPKLYNKHLPTTGDDFYSKVKDILIENKLW